MMNSYSMLNDENALNTINPFVTGGPGGWRKPYGFAPGVEDKDQVVCDNYGCSIPGAPSQAQLENQSYIEKPVTDSAWEPMEAAPLCPWGISAQTNGSLDAPSCMPPTNPVSCPMGRPLEPTQEFVPDLYTQIPYKDPLPPSLRGSQSFYYKIMQSENFPLIAIIIMIVVLLFLAKY